MGIEVCRVLNRPPDSVLSVLALADLKCDKVSSKSPENAKSSKGTPATPERCIS